MQKFQVNSIGKVNINREGIFIALDLQYIPALQVLDGFSHLNVLWWFSDFDDEEMRGILEMPQPYKNAPTIMGIFATRAPIRPNPLALSTVLVIDIDYENGLIEITDIDANDGTPLLDIKPYTPSLDRVEKPSVPEWCSHWPVSLEEAENFNWEKEVNF
jgi:tRNA-Thr(GGU) m(6)t(6)A37 methyltransferase TsaA